MPGTAARLGVPDAFDVPPSSLAAELGATGVDLPGREKRPSGPGRTAASQVTKAREQQYPDKSEPQNDLYASPHR
jgi:hypothetical protein